MISKAPCKAQLFCDLTSWNSASLNTQLNNKYKRSTNLVDQFQLVTEPELKAEEEIRMQLLD